MTDDLVFLDVNVPMYAAGGEHLYKDACAWILAEVAEGNLHTAIDTEIIQEILYRYGALQRWETGATLAASVLDLVPTVLPVTPTDARKAIQLFDEYASQGVKARDLIHAAVMHNNGIDQIISADQHFDLIEWVTRIDPLTLFEQFGRSE